MEEEVDEEFYENTKNKQTSRSVMEKIQMRHSVAISNIRIMNVFRHKAEKYVLEAKREQLRSKIDAFQFRHTIDVVILFCFIRSRFVFELPVVPFSLSLHSLLKRFCKNTVECL